MSENMILTMMIIFVIVLDVALFLFIFGDSINEYIIRNAGCGFITMNTTEWVCHDIADNRMVISK